MTKNFVKIALFALSVSAIVPVASADTFSLRFSDTAGNYTGSGLGTVVVDPNTPNAYDITGGTISILGKGTYTIVQPGSPSGTYVTSPDGAFYYDNVLFNPAVPPTVFGDPVQLDPGGLLFANTTGGEINLYYDNGQYSLIDNGVGQVDGISFGADVTITPATPAVPEPSSLMLLGTGALSAAGFARRRFLKA